MAFRVHNTDVLKSLNPGDRVQFHRLGYSHWGIFVGDENIIHLGGNKGNKTAVEIGNFWKVAGQDKASKNNDRHANWSPLPSEKIIERAFSFVEKAVDYDVFTENCEHFVNWCRYGEHVSDQVNRFIDMLRLSGVAATIPLMIVAAAPVKNNAEETRKRKISALATITVGLLGFAANVTATNDANKSCEPTKHKRLKRFCSTAALERLLDVL